MSVERHLLGWDASPLDTAGAILRGDTAAVEGPPLDPSQLWVVVPTIHVARRLWERFRGGDDDGSGAGKSGVGDEPARWGTVVTQGELLDRLYVLPRGVRVADDLHAMLTRIEVLRSREEGANRALVEAWTPRPPEREDVAAWWRVAAGLVSLTDTLAASLLTPGGLLRLCDERGIDPPGRERWEAVATLDALYIEALAAAGVHDRQRARLDAVRSGGCRSRRDVLLVGTLDLNPLTQAMLTQVAGPPRGERGERRVVSLVAVAEADAAGFNALGVLYAEHWSGGEARLELAEDRVVFVDRPGDAARVVVEAVRGEGDVVAESTRTPASRGLSTAVGVADDRWADTVATTMSLVEVDVRRSSGRPVRLSRPGALLAAAAAWLAERRFEAFADLLRHPDVEAAMDSAAHAKPAMASRPASEVVPSQVTAQRDEAGDQAASERRCHRRLHTDTGAGADWLTLLDDYATRHLQQTLDDEPLGDTDRRAAMKGLWQAVAALLPSEPRRRLPLSDRSGELWAMLDRIYPGGDGADEQDESTAMALRTLREALAAQAALGGDEADEGGGPRVTADEAMLLTLARVGGVQLVANVDQPDAEVIGFLDLALDDAPRRVLVGLNEGLLPEPLPGEPLLPDSLRRRLGMTDAAARLARDRVLLRQIVAARPQTPLIACRRSAEGDPLHPSRLLLSCDDETLARRIQRFYEPPAPSTHAPSVALLTPGDHSAFLIPHPDRLTPPAEPIVRMSVSQFRDYLACPYRFYLRHRLGLSGVDDGAVELTGAAFGTLAHRALARLADDDLAGCDDPARVGRALHDALDRAAECDLGPPAGRRTAVRLQLDALHRRLDIMATLQATWAAQGWRPLPGGSEASLQLDLPQPDGASFAITGRIDRIDLHDTGDIRLLDYKTSDTPLAPEQAHTRRGQEGERQWVDLQLPLYHDLAGPLLERRGLTGRITLGYVNLPRKLTDIALREAQWDAAALAEAREVRDVVIEAVRRGIYWPPTHPPPSPRYRDDLSGLCGDRVLNRAELIARSGV